MPVNSVASVQRLLNVVINGNAGQFRHLLSPDQYQALLAAESALFSVRCTQEDRPLQEHEKLAIEDILRQFGVPLSLNATGWTLAGMVGAFRRKFKL